ncbi:Crp/Fnr family transcriptional regulator [Bacterioplanes sanyensis]|uniref:Crp/Fnr family transcriptional regulator n=1 Tax=Bacterioplanes sanyensis TaxID=1249553 RepID=UPI0012FE11D6|nr:Crp/Fnr family transcriptional regulator [Bacterioplanes sanyensis]
MSHKRRNTVLFIPPAIGGLTSHSGLGYHSSVALTEPSYVSDHNSHAITALLDALQQHYHCSVDGLSSAFIEHHFRQRELPAKAHLIEAGQVAEDVYFIHRGVLRVYYIDQQGNEVNQQFYQAGEVIAPVLSLTTQEASPFYLQALSEADILVAHYPSLHRSGRNNIDWLAAENAILKSVYLKTARREAQMLLGSAEQRYRWFLKDSPELAKQLPLYQIASYLGVTPVSLSRLRKQIKAASTPRP